MPVPDVMSGPVRRRTDVLWREVDGQVVGLDLRSSRYFSLNETGSVLWHLLTDPTEAEVLAGELMRRFGIEDRQSYEDVEAFLTDLRDQGLLEE